MTKATKKKSNSKTTSMGDPFRDTTLNGVGVMGSVGDPISAIYDSHNPIAPEKVMHPYVVETHPFIHIGGSVKLVGDSSIPFKIGVSYFMVGAVLGIKTSFAKGNKKNIINPTKEIYQDARCSIFIPLGSGDGKRAIHYAIKGLSEKMGLEVADPIAITSSEQLLGTTIENESGKRVQNKGHLGDDVVILDECLPIFEEQRHEASLSYIAKALDPIGGNRLGKKLTGDKKEDSVGYYPRCSIVFLYQPRPITERVVTKGVFRRGIIVYVDIDEGEFEDNLKVTLDLNRKPTKGFYDAVDFLIKLKNKVFHWKFTQEVMDLIYEKSLELIEYGKNKQGIKTTPFTQMMKWTLRDLLLKFTVINAACYFREEITKMDVENAYAHLKMFWELELNYIENRIRGRFYQTNYVNKTDEYSVEGINIQLENECYSQETGMQVMDFEKLLSDRINKSIRTAHKAYINLKNMGLIGYVQLDSHETKTWIKDKEKALMFISSYNEDTFDNTKKTSKKH